MSIDSIHEYHRKTDDCIIGERERANLVVRTGDFSVIYIFISGAAYVVSNSTRACANQCKFAIRLACSIIPSVHVFRVSDSAWLSKQSAEVLRE